MNKEHINSRKICFNAPTTRFMFEKSIINLLENLDYSRLTNLRDMDKTKYYLSKRIAKYNEDDYFLYSILYLSNT